MAVTLMPTPSDHNAWLAGNHLRVVGDVDDTLVIPVASVKTFGSQRLAECYYIGLSDGSLIRATNDPDRPGFCVILAGPSGVLIAADGLSISVPGKVTWVALSPNSKAHSIAEAALEPMPLFA